MEGLFRDRRLEEQFTRDYIENMYNFYGYGVYVVCLKESDTIIGRAGISNREVDGENELEVGYVIGKQYQHRGYGVEAVSGVIKFAKENLYAKRLVCFIDIDNRASIKLIEKLNFSFVQNVVDESKTVFAYYMKIL